MSSPKKIEEQNDVLQMPQGARAQDDSRKGRSMRELGKQASFHAPPDTYQLRATGEEARNYDFAAARPPAHTTNIAESAAHLIKSCLGCGMVAIHEAYKDCGLFSALIMNVFLGFGVAYCMDCLCRSAQIIYGRVKVPKMSYPDVVEAAMLIGPWEFWKKRSKLCRYAVDATIVIDLFGSCCVYQVVIARTIKQLVEGTDQVSDTGIRYYMMCLIIPCILVCMITSLKYLAPLSILADMFIVIVAASTIYYGTKSATKSPTEFPLYKSFAGLLEFIGVCVFSVEGVGATMAIENSMTNPRKMGTVIYLGMSIVIALVMVIGFFGYWGFGELARSPITVNFPMSPFPIVLKGMMAGMVFVTFALNFWIPFNLVWVYLQRRHDPSKFWLWERVYRGIFVIAISGIALIFPNVSKFMGLLGSFCLSNMGFIIPAFVDLSLNWEDPGLGVCRWRLIKAILIILFGVWLCIFGSFMNAKEMIKEVFFSKK